MPKLRAFFHRLLGINGSPRAEADFSAELDAHIALHTEEGIRAGLTPEEARRQALLKLGGAEQTRQAHRDRRTLPLVERVLWDLRFALRQMRKALGFTITAVLTLALGIGANAVIYILVDSILLRPLPYPNQARLVRLIDSDSTTFPKGWVRALGSHSSAFTAIAAYGADAESNITNGDQPDRVFGAEVTVNALDTLGIHPAAGSFFAPSDAIAGQDRDVILSHDYWQQRFGAQPSAIGATLRVDGVSRRILGVLPAGVHFPYADTQFLIPVSFQPSVVEDPWNKFDLNMFGRLANGVSPAQAQADVQRLHGVLLPLFPWRMPENWAVNVSVVSLLESETGAVRPRLLLLFGAVGLILLIACANVANLMLARATAREREVAVRSALGASSRRLIQQLLTESAVLGLFAGVVGLVAAIASLRVFVRLLPADTPRIQSISLHPADMLFTLGASLLAGLLFGIIPSARMASLNMLDTLRMGSRGLSGKGARFGLSSILVMAQIGLSVLVVTAAGLVLHSLYNLSHVDPGFQTAHIVTAEVALDPQMCAQQHRCNAFFDSLLTTAQGIPGVENIALADALPLYARGGNYVYDAEDHPRDPRQGAFTATGRTISPSYFSTLGLHLERGRLLNQQETDEASHSVVINQRMAQHLWPNQDPIGKHLISVQDEPTPAVWQSDKASIVVGIVRNSREDSLDANYTDQVYLPMTPGRSTASMYILLRTQATTQEAASQLRRAVSSLDAQAPVTRIRSLDQVLATSVAGSRALAVLLLGFGALAAIIGAVGVYSLIAYVVSWRTREFGLRLALGAQKRQIVLGVVRQSLVLAGGGCLAGLASTLAVSHLLKSFLFQVSALDPATIAAVAALMALIALAAALIPARRAASIDPMKALRSE